MLNKVYNINLICEILQKTIILFLGFFRILKCVTKRECVTSRVRKDSRGYCISISKKKVLLIVDIVHFFFEHYFRNEKVSVAFKRQEVK